MHDAVKAGVAFLSDQIANYSFAYREANPLIDELSRQCRCDREADQR